MFVKLCSFCGIAVLFPPLPPPAPPTALCLLVHGSIVVCCSFFFLLQCMLLSRTHAVKTEACQTALQTFVSSAAAGVDKATLSQHVLETLLYQTQVDVLVGKQQLACHHLEEKIKLQVQDSVPGEFLRSWLSSQLPVHSVHGVWDVPGQLNIYMYVLRA